jgi:hypothetical protein
VARHRIILLRELDNLVSGDGVRSSRAAGSDFQFFEIRFVNYASVEFDSLNEAMTNRNGQAESGGAAVEQGDSIALSGAYHASETSLPRRGSRQWAGPPVLPSTPALGGGCSLGERWRGQWAEQATGQHFEILYDDGEVELVAGA